MQLRNSCTHQVHRNRAHRYHQYPHFALHPSVRLTFVPSVLSPTSCLQYCNVLSIIIQKFSPLNKYDKKRLEPLSTASLLVKVHKLSYLFSLNKKKLEQTKFYLKRGFLLLMGTTS